MRKKLTVVFYIFLIAITLVAGFLVFVSIFKNNSWFIICGVGLLLLVCVIFEIIFQKKWKAEKNKFFKKD